MGLGPWSVTSLVLGVEAHDLPSHQLLTEWDRFVTNTPGTDITQLSAWGRVRGFARFQASYLIAREGSAIVGGAQILSRSIPGLGRLGYIPYGPIVGSAASDRRGLVELLGRAVAEYDGNTGALFVQPPEGAEDMSDELVRRGFRPSRAVCAPRASIRIDLHADEAEIRARFSRRLRSWPNRWAARGVTVRRGDERDITLLADLMRLSARVHRYRPPRRDYLEGLYRELAAGDNVALFVGEVHGRAVSADIVTLCGDMVRGRLGGFDRSGEGGRLSVPAAVRWEIIRWARQAGYRWLDFGGLTEVTLRDVLATGKRDDPAWPGGDRMKMSFGGEVFCYPRPVERIEPWVARKGLDLALRSKTGRAVLKRTMQAVRVRSAGRPQPAR